MKWKEVFALVIFTPPAFLAVMWLVTTTAEEFGRRQVEHERCLKNATNGYEIQQCR
jgi:hypothetical protein